MRYLGFVKGTPAGGWHLHSFASTRLSATHDDDPNGPFLFSPATVQAEDTEIETLKASHLRYQETPTEEVEQVGDFWDRWTLQPDGRFTHRARTERPTTP